MTAAAETDSAGISQRDILKGASALFSEIAFSFGIAIFVKWLEPSLSIIVILFFRYLCCLPLLFAYGLVERGRHVLQINNKKILALRTLSGFLGLTGWFLAVSLIDLSLATALSQTMPIFITLLAAIIIGERVGKHRIGAVLAGFVGVMILLGPTQLTAPSLGVFSALASTFFAALMFVFLRILGRGDAAVSTALWYNIFGTFAAGSMTLVIGADWPDVNAPLPIWGMLIAVGVLASFQQLLMALSHRYAPASVLAPVHYTSIPLGVMIGIVFFDEELTLGFIVGVVIILTANYYILNRERALARRQDQTNLQPRDKGNHGS